MQAKFVLSCESTVDLPFSYVSERNIPVIFYSYTIDGKEYVDDMLRNPEALPQFYQFLEEDKLPSTSQINEFNYLNFFEQQLQHGDLLHIAFGSGMTQSVRNAELAADELREKYPDRKILTIDSLGASLGEGLYVYLAAKKQQSGATIEETYDYLMQTRPHLCHWFTVNDLMHLKRGGRVSATAALLGTMLQIKPVMHMDDEGHLIPVSKARGRKASLQALVQQMVETAVEPEEQTVFICHGDCIDHAEYTASLIREKTGAKTVIINYVGPVIGAHTGPGVISIFFLGTHR